MKRLVYLAATTFMGLAIVAQAMDVASTSPTTAGSGNAAVSDTLANAATTHWQAVVDSMRATQDSVLFSNTPDSSRLYDIFFMEAMVQRQRSNAQRASQMLQYCLELKPQASEACFFLAQYYADQGKAEQALALLERAATIDSLTAIYQETLAQAHLSHKDLDKAIEPLERIVKRDNNREDVLELLLRLYVQQDRHDDAVAVLNRLEQLNGISERLSLTKAGIYDHIGRMDEAIAEVKALADQYPNDMAYRAEYARMLYKANREKQARRVVADMLADDPDNTDALSVLYLWERSNKAMADSLADRLLASPALTSENRLSLLREEIDRAEENGGDSTRMLTIFTQQLSQPKADPDIALLCAAYMELKHMSHDTITTVLEKALTLKPDNAAARLQLVRYAWDKEDHERVIALCQAARQYNPDEMAFYYFQGMAYYQDGKKREAMDSFENGIGVINEESNPDIVSDFYAILGDLLHEQGDMQRAYEAYDSCLQWKPDNIGCLNNYAYFLSVDGKQLDKAEQMSYQTIKAEPKNATYLDTYAWILFMQKRYAEARIYIDQAVMNDSDRSAVITEHAGDIYAMDGQTGKAIELWQKALEQQEGDNALLSRKIKLKKYIKE